MDFTWEFAGSRTGLFTATFRGAVITYTKRRQGAACCSEDTFHSENVLWGLFGGIKKYMAIMRASSCWNHPVNLFQLTVWFYSAPFSSYIPFKKKILLSTFTFLTPNSNHTYSLASETEFGTVRVPSAPRCTFPIQQNGEKKEKDRKGKVKSRWVLPRKTARHPLAEAKEWWQRIQRERHEAMTFLLRLLGSQDLTRKQSCRKTRKTASWCHIISKEISVSLVSLLLFFLFLLEMTYLETFGFNGFPSLLSSNPDDWLWWHDT